MFKIRSPRIDDFEKLKAVFKDNPHIGVFHETPLQQLAIIFQNFIPYSLRSIPSIHLAVDEKNQSMTFAGDMPEGVHAKLMKANFDRLINGASGAASMSNEPLGLGKADLALLISCVGRKLVLKERVEEEIEAVRETVGPRAAITGFYSYGEICPTSPTEKQCQLHNQTMTITTFRE